ncbi:unnamed protein product, partial [Coregonus sp. 'balchen']
FSTAYQCIYYSPEHTAKAQEVLHSVGQLQPLISGLADQLLQAAQQHSMAGLREALKTLAGKTEQFVHALKDELVKSALLALHAAQPGYVTKSQTRTQNQNQTLPGHQGHNHQDHQSPSQRGQQGQSPPQNPGHSPGQPSATDSPVIVCNNDRVWANVAKSLNCVIAMVDKIQEQEPINNNQEQPIPEQVLADVITSHNPGNSFTAECVVSKSDSNKSNS